MPKNYLPLTADRLRELLSYDPETGFFVWKSRRGGVRCWSVAGCFTKKGYRQIAIDGRFYLAHRLAWLYVHGVWPADEIDHHNGARSDNRIKNLREATHEQNSQNLGMRPTNKSGHQGVHWDKKSSKWRAELWHFRRRSYLGLFDSLADAIAARKQAKEKFHTFQPKEREA